MAKSNSSPDIDRALSDLNEQQLLRFQLLFGQQKANYWLIPVAFSGLGIYALVATLLLEPSYSWLIVIIPGLFVVLFVDSILKGVVIEAPSQRKRKDQGLVLVSLSLILVSLFGLCGILIRAEATDGGIIAGVGLLMIYPMALYYFRVLVNKKNELLAETLINQIKSSPARDQSTSSPGQPKP